jgi:hypothetical protein
MEKAHEDSRDSPWNAKNTSKNREKPWGFTMKHVEKWHFTSKNRVIIDFMAANMVILVVK